jgi:hypothetical protein
MNSDIVKDSETLKKALLDRWEEIGITNVLISQDALKMGVKGITERAISVWRHNPYSKGALNQYQILFLAYRYGIRVTLKIGEPIMDGNKLRYIVPQPFNEEQALKDLYEAFPNLKKPRKKKNG